RSAIALIVGSAPTDGMSALGERLVYRDRPTAPRMPRVPDFSRLGIVCVWLSSCTTRHAATPPWKVDAADVRRQKHGGRCRSEPGALGLPLQGPRWAAGCGLTANSRPTGP